jgi:hypothetical protein
VSFRFRRHSLLSKQRNITWPSSTFVFRTKASICTTLLLCDKHFKLSLLLYSFHFSYVPGYRSGCPGFDSRTLQGKKKVVDLERGPLSLVNTTEVLLWRNSIGFGLESREYGRRYSSRWPRGTLYPQKKLALTSLTSGGRSVGIVRLRTEDTSFFYFPYDYFFRVFCEYFVNRVA